MGTMKSLLIFSKTNCVHCKFKTVCPLSLNDLFGCYDAALHVADFDQEAY
jgi:hypothetical protein